MTTTALSRLTGAGSDDIARVMRALLEYTDAWQVAGRVNVPFAELVDILQTLRERGLLARREAVMIGTLSAPRESHRPSWR